MHGSTGAYKKTDHSFFLFTGKKNSTEKTCTMHYHYDLHGNVKTLIQDNAGVSISGHRYKKMEYEYDLISGKVNAVHYQNTEPDQFHHKYEYDADNRITDVYTSKDKILWDHDAKYFYYPHGPLARVEYGDNHVQGMDYAYTLQGWLKGVNSETLENTRDIGRDGNTATGNPNAHFAKDAFGYSLTYYNGDYKSIGTSSFEANKQNSDLLKARNDLFNGNISAMVTTLVPPTLNGSTISYSPLPQGTSYKYDQLNRLVEIQAWQNIDAVNNTWGSGLTYNGMYHNKFTYDGNGNIETAFVKNNLGEIIDDQTYQYNIANGKKTNNRLLAVADAAIQTDGYDLPSTQQTNNYGYTELGELKHDVQDSIAEIKRRVDGKITEVIRTAGSTKKNLKFNYDATGNRVAKHVYTNANEWIKSEYYVRDAQGNILSTYSQTFDDNTQTASFKQTERHLYGSSLLGIDQTQTELIGMPPMSLTSFSRTLGMKSYTGSNHLGNDLVIFTDKKIGIDDDNDGLVNYYIPDVVSSKDYGPFGEYLTGRVFNATTYPNSFNGKRDDEELFGWQDYGFRNYLKAARRFDRVDPLTAKYPHYSPYHFAGNTPIVAIDLDGKEDLWIHFTENDDGTFTEVTSQYEVSAVQRDAISSSMNEATIPNTGVIYTFDHLDGSKEVRKVGETVTVSEYKDNIFVRGAKAANRWFTSTQGSTYGEGEDWVNTMSMAGKASLSFNKYSVGVEGGIYSTSENNAGLYLNFNFDVSVSNSTIDGLNLTNFSLPDASAAMFIRANTANEFNKNTATNSTTLSGEGNIQLGPIGLGGSTDVPLNGDKASGSFEIDFGKGKTGGSGKIKNSTTIQLKTGTADLRGY